MPRHNISSYIYTICNHYSIQIIVAISFALYCGVPALEYSKCNLPNDDESHIRSFHQMT